MHCDTIYKDRGDSCRSKRTIRRKKVGKGRFSIWQSAKEKHPYWNRWLSDAHLRTNVILSGNVLWNTAYAVLQLGLGICHRSAWFYALAIYYASLAIMRGILARYTLRHQPGEKMQEEWRRYRNCGWVFLVMNLALAVMIFYVIYWHKSMQYHKIITISMATYTFTSLTMAIRNVIQYRTYNSPAFSASKIISLAAAYVSMFTLEGTMLATFGKEMRPVTERRFLGISGTVVITFILVMALHLILHGNRQIKDLGK